MIGFSKCPVRKIKYPDFAIKTLSEPNKQYPLLKSCIATTPMFNHLQSACNIYVTKRGWSDIQVFRGQQDLGNLRWIAQAFHIWRDMKDREAEQTGQYFRKRCVRQGKGKWAGAVYINGVFRR